MAALRRWVEAPGGSDHPRGPAFWPDECGVLQCAPLSAEYSESLRHLRRVVPAVPVNPYVLELHHG